MCLVGASSLYVLACAPATSHPRAVVSKLTTLDSLRCGELNLDGRCSFYDVSLYELLANPLAYHGKHVRVIGFAHFEFEGNALYAHREDWQQTILANGLWMDPPPHADSLSDHYVIVEATFDAKRHGHFGMWSGALDSVTRLERWKPPHEPPHGYKIIEPPTRP